MKETIIHSNIYFMKNDVGQPNLSDHNIQTCSKKEQCLLTQIDFKKKFMVPGVLNFVLLYP